MKIYIIGSNTFMHDMVHITHTLKERGVDAWIHPHYEALVRGEMSEQIERIMRGEGAEVKREHNYFREHYAHILESDAVLVINNKKHGAANYIGGNVLIEMGQAYVNDKKIFLLNTIPDNLPYTDEIRAMDPVCLNGNLEALSRS